MSRTFFFFSSIIFWISAGGTGCMLTHGNRLRLTTGQLPRGLGTGHERFPILLKSASGRYEAAHDHVFLQAEEIILAAY